jgi:hypothetical protein
VNAVDEKQERILADLAKIETQYLAEVPQSRRKTSGVTFTPQWVVDLMVRRIASKRYAVVVDAGAGPGRFSVAAARHLPRTRVVAIERNGVFVSAFRALIRRTLGARCVGVEEADFLTCKLPSAGPRLFLGNPPYVRHHSLSESQKAWLRRAGEKLGVRLSTLSGLHVYFLARTLLEAQKGDGLQMILPAEWLEARYGDALKAALLDRCSQIRLLIFDARTRVFADAMTTSVVLELKFGGRTRVIDVVAIDDRLGTHHRQAKVMLDESGGEKANWLSLAMDALNPPRRANLGAEHLIELGEIFSVHRGQVTGKNAVWIATSETAAMIPHEFLRPCITDASEVLELDDGILRSSDALRRVIDLPADLSALDPGKKVRVERFLAFAKAAGAADGYIAKHRKPWWKVGLKLPPPLIMTYMARRPPRFVVNRVGACLINIAHGLYPRERLSEAQLISIAQWLNTNALGRIGRTYSGGLIKLEPGDARRIRIPDPRSFEMAA